MLPMAPEEVAPAVGLGGQDLPRRRRPGAGRACLSWAALSSALVLLGAVLHSAFVAPGSVESRRAATQADVGLLMEMSHNGSSSDCDVREYGSGQPARRPACEDEGADPPGWPDALRRLLGLRGDSARRRRAKPAPSESGGDLFHFNFWEYRATHFAQATVLYVGIRVLPRCTFALLAFTAPALLRSSGVNTSSVATWLLWLTVPYIELFLVLLRYRATHPYVTFLSGWLAFARTKWEIEWACVLCSYHAAQLARGDRGRLIDEAYGTWAPLVKAVLLPSLLAFNCLIDTLHKFTLPNSLTLHALLLLLCSRHVCELVFFFYHQVDPLFEMLAFVLCSLLPPDPAGHARALARLRNLARPWANRMVVFLAAGGGDPNGPRMPDRLPPPPAYWPPPLEVPEGVEEEEEVPHDYRCGISMGLMRLPASTPTGETFDYEPVCTWIALKGTHPTDPLRPLSVEQLHPNLHLRNQIERWIAAKQGDGNRAAGPGNGAGGAGSSAGGAESRSGRRGGAPSVSGVGGGVAGRGAARGTGSVGLGPGARYPVPGHGAAEQGAHGGYGRGGGALPVGAGAGGHGAAGDDAAGDGAGCGGGEAEMYTGLEGAAGQQAMSAGQGHAAAGGAGSDSTQPARMRPARSPARRRI